jgi:hypothetical protein
LGSGTPEAAVRLSSSSSSVLVRLPSYKTVVYTIYLSTIKSAKDKKRAQKEPQEDSFIPSQHKNKLQNQNKTRNNLRFKGSTKIHSIRQPELMITYKNGSQIIFF